MWPWPWPLTLDHPPIMKINTCKPIYQTKVLTLILEISSRLFFPVLMDFFVYFFFLGGGDTSLYLHEVNDKVDQFVSEHDLCVEVGDQEADVITLI